MLFSFETNVQKIINEIQEEEKLLEKIKLRLNEAEVKRNDFKMLLENLCGMPHFLFLFNLPISQYTLHAHTFKCRVCKCGQGCLGKCRTGADADRKRSRRCQIGLTYFTCFSFLLSLLKCFFFLILLFWKSQVDCNLNFYSEEESL